MHAAWSIVLCHDGFWAHLCKDHLGLITSTCSSFRSDTSQRVAIFALFKHCRPVKKAALFRLLPLSVGDVAGLRSPVDFLTAFTIAERRAGGFDRCLAVVREKGWRCWLQSAVRLGKRRRHVENEEDMRSFTICVRTSGDDPRVILRRFFERFLRWSDGDYVRKANRGNVYYVVSCLSDHQSLARIRSGEKYRFRIKSADIPVSEFEAVETMVRFISDDCHRAQWLSEPMDCVGQAKLMDDLSKIGGFGQSTIYRNRYYLPDAVNIFGAMTLAAQCLTVP